MNLEKTLINIYNAIAQVEIKGDVNIEMMYQAMKGLKHLLFEVQKLEREQAELDANRSNEEPEEDKNKED